MIIDTPPLLAVADAAAVARWTDGVLLVTKARISTREAGKKAMELLEKVGAGFTGCGRLGSGRGRAGSAGYGYSSGYYYASYYSMAPKSGKQGKHDNGAQAVGVDRDSAAQQWIPEESEGRRFARVLGKVMTGVLTFLLIVAIAAAVVYFLDQYFGWGMTSAFRGILGG